MDKRKGIILAIVLFLIVGLGTFVFAGGSEGQDNAINPLDDGKDPSTPPTSGEEGTDPAGDGESEGEGGSDGSTPAGGYADDDEQDDVADNNQSTDNDQNQGDNQDNNDQNQDVDDNNGQGNAEDTAYQQALALIAYLEDQIAKAEVRKTLDDAADYRDLNKVADKIAALTDGEDKTDLANRLAAINTILDDTVGPVIDGLPTTKLTNQIVSLSVREEGVTVTLNGDAVTLDDIKNLSKDGTYKVVVTDKALNSTTAEFTVDRTPIGISHLYILNHTYHLDSNYTDKHYTVIGNDQELYVELVLEEEFASTPVITVGDGEGVEMTCGTASWDDTLYKCDAFVTISEDMNFENGDAITFDITGVKDAASNELEIDESLIVETDKYGEVIYDKQAPSVVWLYTLNADDDENLQVIGDGLDLLVELRVDEELLEDPTITIGGYTATLTRRDDSKGRFIYEKRITIDEKLMELVDNEVIPFVITGTDAAGNEVTFTKATTNTDAGYGEVVYDGSAPKYKSLGVLNVTHLRLNNKGASESLTVANIGDEVRVLVRFDEKLDTLPTLVIGDASAEMTLMKSSAEYTYSADITLTADMFDEDGLVDFQVSGYADAVGNVGEVLDVDDIKGYEDYSGVTLDTTFPVVTFSSNGGTKYAKEYNVDVTVDEENIDEVYYVFTSAQTEEKVIKDKFNKGEATLVSELIEGKFSATLKDANGEFYLWVKVVDKAGNVTYARTKNKFKIDTIAADVLVSYNPTEWTNGGVTVTLTASEKVLPVNAGTWNPDGEYATVLKKVYYKNTDEVITVIDRAGNETEVTIKIENIDTTAPIVTFSSNGGTKYAKEYNVDVTVDEENIDEVYYVFTSAQTEEKVIKDKFNKGEATLVSELIEGKFSATLKDANGEFYLWVKVVDKAGNVTYARTKNKFKIDTTAAEVSVSFDETPARETEVIISFNKEIDESTLPQGFSKVANEENTYSKIYNENGKYSYIVKDLVGNETKVNFEITTIDNDNPKVQGVESEKTYIGGYVLKITDPNLYSITYGKGTSCSNMTEVYDNYIVNDIDRENLANGILWNTPMENVSFCVKDSVGNEAFISNVTIKGDTPESIVAALENGGEFTLGTDLVLTDQVNIGNGKELSLDLNGNDITLSKGTFFKIDGGTLNIDGQGTIKEDQPYDAPVKIYRDKSTDIEVNIGEDVTLEGWSGIFITYVSDNNNDSNVTINFYGTINSVIDTAGAAGHGIYINGSNKDTVNYPIINIYDTAKINSLGDGIYAAGYAEWNIYGGTIEAPDNAIGIKAGRLNIFGGTFKATGENNMPTMNFGNGINASGAALQIESNDLYAGDMEITISDGTFISENASAIYEYDSENLATRVQYMAIMGGKFISNNYDANLTFSPNFNNVFNGSLIMGGVFNKENNIEQYLALGYKLVPIANDSFEVVVEQ